jgi:hypothetical protein
MAFKELGAMGRGKRSRLLAPLGKLAWAPAMGELLLRQEKWGPRHGCWRNQGAIHGKKEELAPMEWESWATLKFLRAGEDSKGEELAAGLLASHGEEQRRSWPMGELGRRRAPKELLLLCARSREGAVRERKREKREWRLGGRCKFSKLQGEALLFIEGS